MIDNPDRVQVLYLPFPHDDLQTEGLIVSPREIDLKPKVGIVLPYGMYGTTAKVLRTDANGNLGVSVQGAAGALPATFQDTPGHTLGPLIPESGGVYAAPFSMAQGTTQNIIAPRTDTATYTSADMTAQIAYELLIIARVSAVSGTTPSMTISLQGKTSQGDYYNLLSLSAISGIGPAFAGIGPAWNFGICPPTYRIVAAISGTTPSFTWYLDMLYR